MLPMLYNGQIIDTPEYVVYLAREQRLKLTQSEQLLWSRLKNKQLHGYNKSEVPLRGI
jgi:very-short-patch-repair endonuclease